MKSVLLKWHLGLGDAIVCNGLVRMLTTRYELVRVPAKLQNVSSVVMMFSDLTSVEVVPVANDQAVHELAKQEESIGLGLWSPNGLRSGPWDEQLYRDAGVDFECRWSQCYFPQPFYQLLTPTYPYAFVHEDKARGYAIRQPATDLPVYAPNKRPHILWHLPALQWAAEIHVIDSSFLCLAESLPLHAKLYFHAYARPKGRPPTLRRKWEILK